MEIKGKVVQLLPLITGTGKNGQWRKQEFVIETGDQYPKKILFHLWGDKIDQNPFNMGDEVSVSFDAESREFNGKWYTDLRAWKVVGGQAPSNRPAQPASMEDRSFTEETSDDLPF